MTKIFLATKDVEGESRGSDGSAREALMSLPNPCLIIGASGSCKSRFLVLSAIARRSPFALYCAASTSKPEPVCDVGLSPCSREYWNLINALILNPSAMVDEQQHDSLPKAIDIASKLSPGDPLALKVEFLRRFFSKEKEGLHFPMPPVEAFKQLCMAGHALLGARGAEGWVNERLTSWELKFSVQHSGEGEVHVVYPPSTDAIQWKYLSSGEKSMLEVAIFDVCADIGWLPEIVLLDEQDQHLDPRLCKVLYGTVLPKLAEKRRVVITSHRIDALAFASEGHVFFCKGDYANIYLEACSRLKGLFKVTRNVRSLVDLRVDVYTEAHDDARFYAGVYEHLQRLCERARGGGPSAIEEWRRQSGWAGETKSCVLSRRYQLAFHSSAKKAGGGSGGYESLYGAVALTVEGRKVQIERLSADDWMRKTSLALTYPFGIVDRDYEPHKPPVGHEWRFVDLPRHSLENFIFDPFILASIDVSAVLEGSATVLRDSLAEIDRLCETADDGTGTRNAQIQGQVDKYFRYMFVFAKSRVAELNERAGLIKIDLAIDEGGWQFKSAGGDAAKERDTAKIVARQMIGYARSSIGSARAFFDWIVAETSSHVIKQDWLTVKRLWEVVLPFRFNMEAQFHDVVSGGRYVADSPMPVLTRRGSRVEVRYPSWASSMSGKKFLKPCFNKGTGELISAFSAVDRPHLPLDLITVILGLNEKLRRQVGDIRGLPVSPTPGDGLARLAAPAAAAAAAEEDLDLSGVEGLGPTGRGMPTASAPYLQGAEYKLSQVLSMLSARLGQEGLGKHSGSISIFWIRDAQYPDGHFFTAQSQHLQQSFSNNCGPWAIEMAVQALGGTPIPEHMAPTIHRWLIEGTPMVREIAAAPFEAEERAYRPEPQPDLLAEALHELSNARILVSAARVYHVPTKENLKNLALTLSYKIVGLPIYLIQTADNAYASYQQSGFLHASYTTAQEFLTTWAPYALTFAANPIVASVGAIAVTARQGYALYQDAVHLVAESQDEVASWKAWVNLYEVFGSSRLTYAKARLWIAERELEVKSSPAITQEVHERFWQPAFDALKAAAATHETNDPAVLERAAGLTLNMNGYDACSYITGEVLCYKCTSDGCVTETPQ